MADSIKSTEVRIAELDEKIKQIKAQKRNILNRQRTEERKKRTKRLIEVGATVESVLGRAITREDLPKLKDFLIQQEKRGNFFTKAMNGNVVEK